MRLAQRSYRLKREAELNATRDKAEKAEKTVGKIIESFTKFHKEVASLGNGGRLPLEVMMALSRTALEITNLSHEARSGGEEGGSQLRLNQHENDKQDVVANGPPTLNCPPAALQVTEASHIPTTNGHHFPPSTWQPPSTPSIPPNHPYPFLPYTQAHTNLSFDLRLRLACLEKAVRLLSSPTHSISQIHPVLSLHLKWLPVRELLVLNQESLFRFPNLNIYGPDPHPALPSPDLYRTVEGGELVIERRFGRDVEVLVRGRTRTRVCTDMPGFEGEWMEARDVMEYLEEKGVNFDVAEVSRSFTPNTVEGSPLPPLDVNEEELISQSSGTEPKSISSSSSILNSSRALEAMRPKFRGSMNLQFLIEHLGMSSCCIGPAPAMRKDDVDRALMLSIMGF